MILVMLGPPGSGKGTQSQLLSEKMGIPTLSTGQILRDIMSGEPESELALKVRKIVDRGDLISDEVMTEVLSERIMSDDCKRGVILDGYPRNLQQAHMFEEILLNVESSDYLVLYFDIADDLVVGRLSGRFLCANCNAQYHKTLRLPKVEGVCDFCGSTEFNERKDDSKEAVSHRLKVYNDQTHPLVEHFSTLDKVVRISAEGSIDEITDQIMTQLDLRKVKFESIVS